MAEFMLWSSLLLTPANLRNILVEADRSVLTGTRRIGDE
jgi:hypothetical protein